MVNKRTAWYDNTVLPKAMVEAAIRGKKDIFDIDGKRVMVPAARKTHPYLVLDSFIKSINNCVTIADVGCGAAELGDIYKEFDYTGFDLPHIIDGVANVVNPNLKYVKFDAQTADFSVFKNFDLIICNGFISELPNPLEILNKLLMNMKKHLIIHRQFFNEDKLSLNVATNVSKYKTYGDLEVVRADIGKEEFNNLLTNHIIIKEESNVFGKSILIEKI